MANNAANKAYAGLVPDKMTKIKPVLVLLLIIAIIVGVYFLAINSSTSLAISGRASYTSIDDISPYGYWIWPNRGVSSRKDRGFLSVVNGITDVKSCEALCEKNSDCVLFSYESKGGKCKLSSGPVDAYSEYSDYNTYSKLSATDGDNKMPDSFAGTLATSSAGNSYQLFADKLYCSKLAAKKSDTHQKLDDCASTCDSTSGCLYFQRDSLGRCYYCASLDFTYSNRNDRFSYAIRKDTSVTTKAPTTKATTTKAPTTTTTKAPTTASAGSSATTSSTDTQSSTTSSVGTSTTSSAGSSSERSSSGGSTILIIGGSVAGLLVLSGVIAAIVILTKPSGTSSRAKKNAIKSNSGAVSGGQHKKHRKEIGELRVI